MASFLAAQSRNLTFITSHLPEHCEPSAPFLAWISSILHTCVPTPLALTSTLLGWISITSWLFAQLPQIIKNHQLKSTSGLSVYFLIEWCLGDMSNLFGAILTKQATWQIVVGGYYCFVDLALVGQWIWFEGLGRGSTVRMVWRRVSRRRSDQDLDAMDVRGVAGSAPGPANSPSENANKPRDIPPRKDRFFRTPDYGSFHSTKEELSYLGGNNSLTTHRLLSNPLPSPSPRTVLLVSLILCMASTTVTASPMSHERLHDTRHATLLPLGTILSWISTTLYLCSRLPQLLKNFRLRSTAGLSPLLFAAAFFGNLFYSSSLLLNPNLWHDFPPYGGGGWAGPEGNNRIDWMLSALPFWLGAAGVLVMDAGIGVQFWLWGEKVEAAQGGFSGAEEVLVIERNLKGKRTWKEVHGWMRGWMPSVSGSIQRIRSPRSGSVEEPLLGGGQQAEL